MLLRLYHVIATLALLNLLAIGTGVVWLIATDRLDVERARRIAEVMFGEGESAGEDSAEQPGEPASAGAAVSERLGPDRDIEDEIRWRNIDRYRAQIEQRLKFVNAARLEVERRREEFERLKERERSERQRLAQEAGKPGYEKELEIIAALSPKAALKQVMTMPDADAARLLFQLDSRKVKRIFEAARTDAELGKLTTVRELIRDMRPLKIDVASTAGPGGSES